MIWDFIKCRIRTETITYSINKRKRDKKDIETLNIKLLELEEKICSSPTPDYLEEYDLIQNRLENMYDKIANGALIRSRCKHLGEFERPTKYFLNMEKANCKKKHIQTLTHNGQRIKDPQKILEMQMKYFSDMYSEANILFNNDEVDTETYLKLVNLPKISDQSRALCENAINIEEVKKAVSSMSNNKSPGPDGIPCEFYRHFWNEIGDHVYNSYTCAFNRGELSPSQRQGVINLVPKKDKELTDLKSWRPLSILNTDYKILAKALSNRLKITLTEIINPDQVGYMKDRYFGENVRLIADILEYCKYSKTSCIILLADFEKAFDTIKWSFMGNILRQYGFGVNFRKWISVLYTNAESCVSNNGYLSPYFKLSRGIRQGCPISALLFLLIAEVIAILLRNSDEIKGLSFQQVNIKLCQLADDMTLFLSSTKSVLHAINLFEEF